ncbi:MAG TPA: STAS domain-containing protein [Candidatus Gallacutalibacter pullicola]|uniref:Anti-sigma factor antagonist n=1 Tax=Candidatus Gallacutalibacter pullicola TaxID=2840830 RepID=A0A9D1DNN8_9FIRM|nr:STAS domain-containing protein [Candidatus Gallacutalibacter pullicola]
MNIAKSADQNGIVLSPEGRVDTLSAPQLQAAILQAFQSEKKVTLDFSGVPYISSAGLRALLIGQKTATAKGGSMMLRNVSEMVMNVLDMSGFSNILNIL